MSDKNIVLIGFMGTGKSTVGKILAKKMNRALVDIDYRIEEKEKRKISEIFEKEGEDHFRCLEKEMIRDAASHTGQVITTGGGAVVDPENLAALKSNGLLVALTAFPETIYQRVKDTRHRPLLKSGDLMSEIRRLLAVRMPSYEKADLHFSSDGKTPAQVADQILEALEKEEEFEFGKDWF
jgi:shikimate kinase